MSGHLSLKKKNVIRFKSPLCHCRISDLRSSSARGRRGSWRPTSRNEPPKDCPGFCTTQAFRLCCSYNVQMFSRDENAAAGQDLTKLNTARARDHGDRRSSHSSSLSLESRWGKPWRHPAPSPLAASERSLPARRRDRIVEQSLDLAGCDGSCSQAAARTCLCSNPALFLLGPSAGADGKRSGAALSGNVPKPGAVQPRRPFCVVIVYYCVKRAPPVLSLAASCLALPVAGLFGCTRRQRPMQHRTNTPPKQKNQTVWPTDHLCCLHKWEITSRRFPNATRGRIKLQRPKDCPLGCQ